MKTFLTTLGLIACTLLRAQAQETAPIVAELRAVLADAGTGFQSYRGELIESDSASGVVYYKSTHTPQASISAHYLIENSKTKHRFYLIRYDIKALDAMQLRIMTVMAQKYMEELNAMASNGKFAGRDYKNEEGADVTELKDKSGQNIIDYQSDADQQMIIVYGTDGH